MADNGKECGPKAEAAQAEFAVIADVLRVPPDLPKGRQWRGGCLFFADNGVDIRNQPTVSSRRQANA
jgi:hypothetical protein